MRRTLTTLLVPSLLALAGCIGDDDGAVCTPEREKGAVQDLMWSWYLYPELLADVAPADPALPTVQAYLDALTANARALGVDRGWTYATTRAQTQQFYEEGTSVGFGVGLLLRGTRELVSQVFPGSAAAEAGFVRGDEILAIGETAETLVDVPTLVAAGTLGSAFGPSQAGVTRTFRVLPAGGTEPVLRTMTKRVYGLDPVPAWIVLRPEGRAPVGYVALRTFIGPADALLAEAFLAFRQEGVGDVIVDLRYNGGGLVSTAAVLANLLGADRSATDVMYTFQNNETHAGEDLSVAFSPPAGAIAPARIAFITTGASASASELVPNALEGWRGDAVGLVGARTYGKPVGQRGWGLQGCDTVVYAVSFRLVNVQGDGAYFDGLPDASGNFSGPLCEAADDLTRAQGDPAEASTAAALEWLSTGQCPTPPAAKPSGPRAFLKAGAGPDAYPEASEPDLAQRHVRGLF